MKNTNKEIFARYAEVFGLEATRGLSGGQWVILDSDKEILGSFETSTGAYSEGPVFHLRQFKEDQWSGRQEDPYTMPSDDASKAFTRAQLEHAIVTKTPLHDTQPDRRTKK